ncbi:hypothetical protein [Kitasatospora sp. NPDC057738]|uniref:hypothetical protein n=1 Tax=Kitasatospora sp. NPDC057738 TaxID=3346233 RepID=UPI003678E660
MAYAEKVFKVRDGKKTTSYTWRARYKKPDGTWGSEPGFATKKTAEDWGDEQEAAIRSGTWVDPELARGKLGTWVKLWLEAQGDSPRGRTTMNRRELLANHILPQWEHTPLIAFTWFDVETWARNRSRSYAESTVRAAVGLLSQILTGAVDAKRLTVNPLYNRRLTGLRVEVKQADTQQEEDEEEIPRPEVVLEAARRMGPWNGLKIVTEGWTGVRYEESCGLHRRNTLLIRRQRYDGGVFECPIIRIDKEEGVWAEYYVYDADGKRSTFRGFEPPKNPQSARDVDVPPFLAALLADRKHTSPHDIMFCTPTGKMWWRSTWHTALRPAADGREERPRGRGGPPQEAWEPLFPGLTSRTLRKFHDSLQAELEVPEVLAHEQMGHKYRGIKGVYRRPTPAMRQRRLEGLEATFQRAMANLGWKSIWE